jgi:glycosyltransferase involved in cell wall biosynthesis
VKVLHVITGLGVGGAELQLRSILQHSRHEGDVVSLYNPGPVADMIRGDGVSVRDLGMTSNTQMGVLWRLRALIRDGGYDVVHAHLYRSQIYGRPAAWLAGSPVVVSTEHSIGETHLERRKMTTGVRALYLATERMSDANIAVSATVRDRMINWGVKPDRITVIPNGVDLSRVAFDPAARARIRTEFGLAASDYVIGVLGRLDPNKQFDLVIEAAAPLLGNGTRLMIVGKAANEGQPGDERARLEETAARCGVTEQVIFTGERHDVAAMLSAMDLFVASSAQETFGLSVLEALANGAPVLYTTCPALEGLDVSRARQVPSEVAGMREAMAAEIGAGQRDRVPEPAVEKEYGIQAVTNRIDDLYETLAARRHMRTILRKSRRAAAGPASTETAGAAGTITHANGSPAGPSPASTAAQVAKSAQPGTPATSAAAAKPARAAKPAATAKPATQAKPAAAAKQSGPAKSARSAKPATESPRGEG